MSSSNSPSSDDFEDTVQHGMISCAPPPNNRATKSRLEARTRRVLVSLSVGLGHMLT
jgi:hypothetical protein